RVQRGVLEARLESGRAEAEKAAADLARARRLIERNIVAGEELDAARALAAVAEAGVRAAEAERAMQEPAIRAREARVEMAAADLATARAAVARVEAILARTKVDLSRTIIRAPIDGVVIDRNVDRGQTVAASLEAPTLFTIANDLRRMELHARVDEADVGQMRVGAPASFTVDAYPGERFSGQVSQIRKAPQRIQNVVTYTVLITAGNPELRLLPGMTAIADIVTETRENTLAVPNAALRFAPAGQVAAPPERTDGRLTGRLWRLSPDGEAEAVAVALGITDGSLTEILGGLEDGDRVAIGTRSGG
ncbi:MAG: efflux RND transporter periplasmic adaptor subunit, partial [Paracoccaceae bacterium]